MYRLQIALLLEVGSIAGTSAQEHPHASRILLERLRAEPDWTVNVPGLGRQRLADVIAALSDVELRKFARGPPTVDTCRE